jgi:PhnB protein
MTSSGQPTPYQTVIPRVFVDDVDKAVAFLRAVFGATAEIETGRPTDVRIGNSVVMVSSTAEREPFPAFLYVYVEDADNTYERAMRAGAQSIEEPTGTPYGHRRSMFSDAYGNVYQAAHPLDR